VFRAGVPEMVAGLPGVNFNPCGSPKVVVAGLPFVEIVYDPGEPAVNVVDPGVRKTGVFATVRVKGCAIGPRFDEPRATGVTNMLNVPVVFAGGVPLSTAVPSPLSWKVSQGAFAGGAY